MTLDLALTILWYWAAITVVVFLVNAIARANRLDAERRDLQRQLERRRDLLNELQRICEYRERVITSQRETLAELHAHRDECRRTHHNVAPASWTRPIDGSQFTNTGDAS